ncbi:unnamed protein product [marine sediment metagenome]|uniref:Uncharacterized protein n=1 Tax=marine sediment metagenome TaxID=412755 RepID=X1PIF6_9ZZZZ
MKSKIDYYILIPKIKKEKYKDKFFMTKAERKRFYKNLNKIIDISMVSIKEFGDAFRRMAKILRYVK